MKKSILLGIGVIASSLLVSCHDDWNTPAADGSGFINPFIDLDTQMTTSRSTDNSSRADGTEITAADLALRLTYTDGEGVWNWASVAEFDKEKQFKIGNYLFEAYYGDAAEQGFDLPSYYGSQTITVEDGQTTPVAVTATMSKSMITIKYTDAFQSYMSDWSASVNDIEYIKGEDRPVYVTPGDVTVKISVTKPNGVGGEFTLDKIDAKARYHYTLTVDVNEGNVGDAVLTVTFDEYLEEEDIEIDLSDRLLLTPAPTVTAKGFTSGEPIDVLAGSTPDNDLTMDVLARAKMKAVTLKTASVSLLQQGWPEEVDLLSAGQQLKSLGFDAFGLWNNPDQMAQLDFTGVVKNIKHVAGADNNVTFTVTVKDNLLRESEATVLALNIETVQLELAKGDAYYSPGDPLKVVLGYNGKNVKEDVKFQYFHRHAGVWHELSIAEVSQPSRAMSNFTVTLNVPALDEPIRIQATCGGTTSNEIEVGFAPFSISYEENNVFATYAYVDVVGISGHSNPTAENKLEFHVLNPETNKYEKVEYTDADGLAKISGLHPGITNKVKVSVDGQSARPVELKTEAAIALENGDMEDWQFTNKTVQGLGGLLGSATCTIYTCTGWATLNELTTSALDYRSNYSGLSSTLSTEEAHAGTAALIRTVGYGRGSATDVRYYSKGELYLGNTVNNDAVYGIPFAGRPTSLSFYYKYNAYSEGDKGYAEISVLDAEGNVLATNTVNLEPTSAYTLQKLNLNYELGAKKAASLQIIFRSTYDDAFVGASFVKKIVTGSGLSAKLNDYVTGSELYVDDIKLNY